MSDFRANFRSWMRLPPGLKFFWFVIGAGVVLLAWGYLNRIPSMSWTGLGVFVAGYLGGWFHGWGRRDASPEARGFYVALLTGPVAGIVFCVITLVLAVLFFVGVAIFGEFAWAKVLRILHFIGVLFCACVFISLPGTARRQREHEAKAAEEAG